MYVISLQSPVRSFDMGSGSVIDKAIVKLNEEDKNIFGMFECAMMAMKRSQRFPSCHYRTKDHYHLELKGCIETLFTDRREEAKHAVSVRGFIY